MFLSSYDFGRKCWQSVPLQGSGQLRKKNSNSNKARIAAVFLETTRPALRIVAKPFILSDNLILETIKKAIELFPGSN